MYLQVLAPSSGFLDYAISMRPDYHQAIIDTVRYYGWKRIIYLYDSHDASRCGCLLHSRAFQLNVLLRARRCPSLAYSAR
ncbi:hypothetical protein J6590_053617 [Homalodisca vitripennis]|nr:hypothetical protein J6590_053617 [Homalodisca vitripennis]